MTLDKLLRTGLDDDPERTALAFRDEAISYRDLDDAVDLSARGLLSRGVGHGDRVAIFMKNRLELVELYFACFRMGAIAVPLNHRFQTDEVIFATTHCEAAILLVDGDLLPVVEGVGDAVPSLRGVYAYGDAPATAEDLWSDVLDAAPAQQDRPTVAVDDPAMILYTSGSTGKPKGVTHTHRSILDTVDARVAIQKLTSADVSLAATAICHAGGSIGVTFAGLNAGGTVVILEESDPALFLAAVARHRPTRTLLLPAQLLDAVEAPGAADVDFGCLVEVECGGDQISPDLYERFAEVADVELNQVYGMTECEGATMNPPFGQIKAHSIGVPREGVEIRMVDAAGATVDHGEMVIRSASVMAGYWNDPEHTEAAFLDGWLRTGDVARRDADGYLHFEGRIKEIIIKGGSNIAPGEVEDVLDSHPDVELSGVVGSPDPRLGALVHAFIEVKEGVSQPPSEQELTAFASERLAKYKVPDRWTFLEDLPRNPVGKIDRHALHARAAQLDSPST